jgi:hypothetical protein
MPGGRRCGVEFRVRWDLVEVWQGTGEWLSAVFVRDELRKWFDAPYGALAADEVIFDIDAWGLPLVSARGIIAGPIRANDVTALKVAL